MDRSVMDRSVMDRNKPIEPHPEPPCADPCEEDLDQALEDSFPASDPPSYAIPHRNEGPKADPEQKNDSDAQESKVGGRKWPDHRS